MKTLSGLTSLLILLAVTALPVIAQSGSVSSNPLAGVVPAYVPPPPPIDIKVYRKEHKMNPRPTTDYSRTGSLVERNINKEVPEGPNVYKNSNYTCFTSDDPHQLPDCFSNDPILMPAVVLSDGKDYHLFSETPESKSMGEADVLENLSFHDVRVAGSGVQFNYRIEGNGFCIAVKIKGKRYSATVTEEVCYTQ